MRGEQTVMLQDDLECSVCPLEKSRKPSLAELTNKVLELHAKSRSATAFGHWHCNRLLRQSRILFAHLTPGPLMGVWRDPSQP